MSQSRAASKSFSPRSSSHRASRLPHKRVLAVLSGLVAVTASVGLVVWATAGGAATPSTRHSGTSARSQALAVRTEAEPFTMFSGAGHGVVRPRDVAVGSDGNLWFTAANDRVGRITPEGKITLFNDPAGRLH